MVALRRIRKRLVLVDQFHVCSANDGREQLSRRKAYGVIDESKSPSSKRTTYVSLM